MRFGTDCIASLLVLVNIASGLGGICKNFGSPCPQSAPCCLDGWCSSDLKYCATGCQPENSFTPESCFPKPPCVSFREDFDSPRLVQLANFTGDPMIADWTSDFTPDNTEIENGNLVLSMKLSQNKNEFGRLQGFGATISSVRWIEYGTITARIKTASTSVGVVSSFITRNLFGDEIDFEWVGKNPNEVQQNFYYDNILNYTNARFTVVDSNTSEDYHVYTIDWQPDYLRWLIDGQELRVLKRNDTWDPKLQKFKYPNRAQRVQFSLWDGGQGPEGTMLWAGGRTNWSDPKTAYKMYIDWVDIQCKYNGNETTPWPGVGVGVGVANPTNSGNATPTPSIGIAMLPTSANRTSSTTSANLPNTNFSSKNTIDLLFLGLVLVPLFIVCNI
ncbi:putative glycosidase CRH2 [Basidiobolus ranarum]|uniref:Glycosidase CRH2 n=1 Tax=Basidiobolus ranarum TaxID=34480 RepID=A0ABR2WB09_9FUNG